MKRVLDGISILPVMPGPGFNLAFLVAFYRCGSFSFSHLCGFFVKFPPMDFGQDPGLFAGALEAAQCEIERFVFSYFNTGH